MSYKICSRCTIEKDVDSFGFRSDNHGVKKHGHKTRRPRCRSCESEHKKIVSKTKDGLISKIYTTQKLTSKKRGHSAPTYSLQELKEWLYSQEKFHKLYDNWKRLDFQKDYIPSVDRKDDYIGYTMDNIQLMTFRENYLKSHEDKRNNINTKAHKAVIKFSKCGEFISEYKSIKQAATENNMSKGNICSVCKGSRKSSGGYIWKYKTEVEDE